MKIYALSSHQLRGRQTPPLAFLVFLNLRQNPDLGTEFAFTEIHGLEHQERQGIVGQADAGYQDLALEQDRPALHTTAVRNTNISIDGAGHPHVELAFSLSLTTYLSADRPNWSGNFARPTILCSLTIV